MDQHGILVEPPMEGEAKQESQPVLKETEQKLGDLTEHHIGMTFPQKLMKVLSDEMYTDSIAWLPHGNGFIIHQKNKFAEDVLPKFFKQCKFTSFTRKLNRWGFTRVTKGPEAGAYFHKNFVRDEPNLCLQMHCQSTPKFGPNSEEGYPSLAPTPQVMMDPMQLNQILQLQQMQIQKLQQSLQTSELLRSTCLPQVNSNPLQLMFQQQQQLAMANSSKLTPEQMYLQQIQQQQLHKLPSSASTMPMTNNGKLEASMPPPTAMMPNSPLAMQNAMRAQAQQALSSVKRASAA